MIIILHYMYEIMNKLYYFVDHKKYLLWPVSEERTGISLWSVIPSIEMLIWKLLSYLSSIKFEI